MIEKNHDYLYEKSHTISRALINTLDEEISKIQLEKEEDRILISSMALAEICSSLIECSSISIGNSRKIFKNYFLSLLDAFLEKKNER